MSLAVGTDAPMPAATSTSNTDASAVADANANGVNGTPAPAQAAPVTVTTNPVVINPILSKYLTAFIHIALVVLTAVTAITAGGIWNWTVGVQLGVQIVGAFGVYFVPLVNARWQGWVKTVIAIAVAAGTVAAPLIIDGHISATNWIVIGGAVINTLATQLGIDTRTDTNNKLAQ